MLQDTALLQDTPTFTINPPIGRQIAMKPSLASLFKKLFHDTADVLCGASRNSMGLQMDLKSSSVLEDAMNFLRAELQKERSRNAADIDSLNHKLHCAHLKHTARAQIC